MRQCTISLVLAAFSIAGIAAADEPPKDSFDKVKENLAKKQAVIVDVREQAEWDRGHLQDAQFFPLSELKRAATDPAVKEKLAKTLPKDRIVYCHCAKGVRALMAGNILKPLGYDVRPLAAGYDRLREAGFAAAKQDRP
jgi:rhodanese-related sulfurtransferase